MLIDSFKLITKNNLETEQVGYNFSKKISKGDIITLNGNLGSGKTTFVKGVLKGLNYQYEVTSPTYTLINEYNADYNIIHIDCYREKNVNRWKRQLNLPSKSIDLINKKNMNNPFLGDYYLFHEINNQEIGQCSTQSF